MRHGINHIANNRFLDPQRLIEVVSNNPNKYGAVQGSEELGGWTVSTWHVDDLVADYYTGGGQRIVPN